MTIEKFEINPMLVIVNKLKPYKYMEFEIQTQEQMLVYWEQSANGVQAKTFNTEEENEDCEYIKTINAKYIR